MPRKQRFKPSRKPKPAVQDDTIVPQQQSSDADEHAPPEAEPKSFDTTDIEAGK